MIVMHNWWYSHLILTLSRQQSESLLILWPSFMFDSYPTMTPKHSLPK